MILLLVAGSAGHALALLMARRRQQGWRLGAAALAQGMLLTALAGVSSRWLETNDTLGWLPTRTTDALQSAASLALALYLVAGFWWRSPGLGVTLPLGVLGLLLLADTAGSATAVTRGLPIDVAWRPAAGAALAASLALATLAVAGLVARWVEARGLGQPRLRRRVIAWQLSLAAGLLTLIVAGAAWTWLPRGRPLPTWSLQQTWLVASWIVLVVAAESAWRRHAALPALAIAAAGVLLVSLVVVAGVGLRA